MSVGECVTVYIRISQTLYNDLCPEYNIKLYQVVKFEGQNFRETWVLLCYH